MKIKSSLLIIFLFILIILAGLIFMSFRLSEQQRVAMRNTEQASMLLTNVDITPGESLIVNTLTITSTSTPKPTLGEPTLTQISMQTDENTPTITVETAVNPVETTAPTNISPSETLPTSTLDVEVFTPIDWTGSWTAFFGDEGGTLFRASLLIRREGNTITGIHGTQIFTGTLSADGLSVIGTWLNPPSSGEFSWQIVGENQFCGNTDRDFAYCGARNAATRPDPCRCISPVE